MAKRKNVWDWVVLECGCKMLKTFCMNYDLLFLTVGTGRLDLEFKVHGNKSVTFAAETNASICNVHTELPGNSMIR